MAYTVFARSWYTADSSWPDGKRPHMGRKKVIKKNVATAEEAQDICRVYNANNPPGKMSHKAEYERE